MITPRVLANQLINTRWAIHPRLQDRSSPEIGSLVPILHLLSRCPWQPQAPAPEFPQLLPPRSKFLSSETDTLAWATGTRVGASDHTIALFCIGSGRVLGFCILIHYILWLIMRNIWFRSRGGSASLEDNPPKPTPPSPSPTRRDNAELQFGGEMVQQMATTSFHAEGRRLEHQEELAKRWRVTTRSKAVAGEDS